MRVFLVDDDYEDHEIFKMALDSAEPGAELFTAESGIEAIEKLREENKFIPDIIFFDVNMPRMTGKECIRQLRQLKHLEKIPMILYSTHDDKKEFIQAKEVGASDFVTKPASISEYIKTLKTVIDKHVKSQN